jgi:hypothetical protein
MSQLSVVQFPERVAALDVPEALRGLADAIEAGEHGDAFTLLWVIDCGDGRVDMGLMGKAGEPGTTAYFLAGLAQRKIEQGIG